MNFYKFVLSFLVIILLEVFTFAGYFKDVPTNHWAYKQAVALSKLGILKGYPDGTFRGEQQVTRYQLAVALYNLVLYVQEYVTDKTKNLLEASSLYTLRTEISKIADMSSKAYKWSSENTKAIQELQKAVSSLKVPSGNSSPANIDEILNEIISLKTDFDSKLQQFDVRYGNEISSMKDKINKIEIKVNDLARLVNKEKVSSVNSDYDNIASLSRKYNNLDIRLSAVEQKLKGFYDNSVILDVYSIRKDIVGLQEKYSSLKEDIDDLSKRVLKLEDSKVGMSEFKNFVDKQQKFNKDMEDIKKGLERFQTEIEDLKGFVNSLKSGLNSYSTIYSKDKQDINKKISDLKSQVEKMTLKMEDVEKKLKEVESKKTDKTIMYSYIFSVVLFAVGVGIAWYLK